MQPPLYGWMRRSSSPQKQPQLWRSARRLAWVLLHPVANEHAVRHGDARSHSGCALEHRPEGCHEYAAHGARCKGTQLGLPVAEARMLVGKKIVAVPDPQPSSEQWCRVV